MLGAHAGGREALRPPTLAVGFGASARGSTNRLMKTYMNNKSLSVLVVVVALGSALVARQPAPAPSMPNRCASAHGAGPHWHGQDRPRPFALTGTRRSIWAVARASRYMTKSAMACARLCDSLFGRRRKLGAQRRVVASDVASKDLNCASAVVNSATDTSPRNKTDAVAPLEDLSPSRHVNYHHGT